MCESCGDVGLMFFLFFFSSRRRHTRCSRDWSSDVCSSDLARGEVGLVVAAIFLGGGVLAAWPVILSYAAELYPTRIRATAVGWASAAGRTGAILAPALLGVLLHSWTSGRGLALGLFACALVIAALIVFFLGEETAGRPLEDVAEAARGGARRGS